MLGKILRGRFWLTFLLLVALGLAVTAVLRKDIAAWALSAALEGQDFKVTSLTVTELGWQRSAVQGVAAEGAGVSLALETLELEYRLFGLLSGDLPAVFLSGADLFLDLESPWLKSRMGDSGSASVSSEELAPVTPFPKPLPSLPDVTLADSQVRLLTPIGPLEVAFDGTLRQAPDTALSGAFNLDAKGGQGQSKAVAEFTVSPDRSVLADLQVAEGSFDIGDLKLRGMSGRFAAAFDGRNTRIEELDAELELAQVSGALSPSVALAPLQLSIAAGLAQEDVVFDLKILSEGPLKEVLQAGIQGRVASRDEAVKLQLTSSIESPASLPLFSKFHLPLPEAGQIAGKAEVNAVLPPLADLRAAEIWTLPPARWLESVSSMQTEITLQTDGLSHPDYLEGLTADVAAAVKLKDAAVSLDLKKPVTAEVVALSEDLLSQLSLPDDLRSWMGGPMTLKLAAFEDKALLQTSRADILTGPYTLAGALDLTAPGFSIAASPSGALTAEKAEWALGGPVKLEARKLPLRGISGATGKFDLELAGAFLSNAAGSSVSGDLTAATDALVKDDARITGLQLTAPLRGELAGQLLQLVTTGPAVARAKSLSMKTGVSTTALKLDIAAAELAVDLTTGVPRPKVTAQLAPAGFALGAEPDVVSLETEPVDLSVSPQTEAAGVLLINLDTSAVSLPDQEVQAADVALRAQVNPDSGEAKGRFTDLRLEDTAAARRFDEVFLDGSFQQNPAGRLNFSVKGRSFQDAINFEAKGRSVPEQGLSVDVILPPHDFAETPLSLTDLSWISDARIEEGTMSGSLQITMAPDGPVGFARLASEDLGGEVLGFPFSDLVLAIDLDGLWPPRTAQPIKLSLGRINPGLPVSDFQIEATLPSEEAFRLDLPSAAFSLLGARISFDGGQLALLKGTADLPIRITGLDLAEVLKAADLADVNVSGRLAGDLPISFDDGVVTLRRSKLAATEAGVLQVRSDEVAELLTGYGTEVDSMLRALEDFRYDDLSLTLEKTADDDLTLLLSILGNNPAVLDGQPFRLNLNLESNIGQILNTLGEGLEISKDLLSGRYSLQ